MGVVVVTQRRRPGMKGLALRPGPSKGGVASVGPPPTEHVFGRQAVRAACRVRLLRNGGFVPYEVRYPARSTLHARTPSLGRDRHRPVPARGDK